MADKIITVRFTARELYELDCLLANGVCDYDAPGNEVARSAYDKIGEASRKGRSGRAQSAAGEEGKP